MIKIRNIFYTIIVFVALIAMGYYLLYVEKYNLSYPIRQTINIVENIGNEMNNPPPLKFLNENYSSNLTVQGVLDWTNEMRKTYDLKELKENDNLDAIAMARLNDMFQKQYFEHISPEGISVSDIAKDDNYEYITIGENIALGNFDDDEALVNAWMNSPGHRANILNNRYTEIGIAVKKGNYENRKTWMAIQVFALPVSACPKVDSMLKEKIDVNNSKINDLEKSAADLRNTLDGSNPKSINEVSIYNNNVKKYNQMISQINNLINETKGYIQTYNSEVEAYNACAKGS